MMTRAPRLRSLIATALVASVLVPLAASPAAATNHLGIIDGWVYDPGTDTRPAFALGNICVQAFDQQGNPAGPMATTSVSDSGQDGGYFEIFGIPVGVYTVRYRDCGSQRVGPPSPFPATLSEGTYSTGFYSGGGTVVGSSDAAQTVAVTAENAASDQRSVEASATLPLGARISGQVNDAVDQTLLGGVCVQILDNASGALVAETLSSDGSSTSQGAWSIPTLLGGSYKVFFRDDLANCASIGRPAGNGTGPTSGGLLTHQNKLFPGNPVALAAQGSSPNILVSLDRISQSQGFQGTVRDDAGAPAGGVCVSANNWNNPAAPVQTTTTNSSGAYTLSVPVGDYWIELHERCVGAAPHTDDVYVAEVHPNIHYADGATAPTPVPGSPSAKLTVSTNQFTALNPSVAKRGTISGRVTNEATPLANLAGICVVALEGQFAQTNPPPYAVTAADGTYTIPGIRPANYVVRFIPNDQSPANANCEGKNTNTTAYLSEYFDNSNSRAGATVVSVANGQAQTGKNASLRAAGTTKSISGRVTRDGSSTVRDGLCVSVLDQDGGVVSTGLTQADNATTTTVDESGNYQVTGIAPGQYVVQFSRPSDCGGAATNPGDSRYIATEFYSDRTRLQDAAPVTVGTADVTGINASVGDGSRITGTVTFPSGTPAEPICVELLDSGQSVRRHLTTSGAWTMDGFAAGQYFARFDDRDPSGTCGPDAFADTTDTFVTEFYLDKRTFADATPFTVAAAATRSGIDAQMDRVQVTTAGQFGSISGYVYDPDLDGTSTTDQERPLNGMIVEAFRFDQDPGVDKPVFTTTTRQRQQTVTYLACPDTHGVDNPATQACEVSPARTTPPGGTTEPAVTRTDTITTQGYWRIDASNQSVPLTVGSYKLRFRDPQGIHAGEWYRSQPTFVGASSVALATGQHLEVGEKTYDVDNYDADRRAISTADGGAGANTDPEPGTSSAEFITILNLAGNLAGRVSAVGSGDAVKDVRVNLLQPDSGNIVATAFTAADGRYQMPGLAAGTYKVHFIPSTTNHRAIYYNAQETFGSANPVEVRTSASTSAINAQLPVNTAPKAGDDRVIAEVNKTTTFATLLSNDVDAEGDRLTIASITQPTPHGTATLKADGTVSFTPKTDSLDDTTFTYTVKDEQGLTDVATVTIDMVGKIIGAPPVAADDEVATAKNTAVTISPLANDIDPDGDNSKMTLDAVGTPFHGTATISGKTVIYTPANNFAGVDQFAYTVKDTQGYTATAKITVRVASPSDTAVDTTVAAGGTVSTNGTSASPTNNIITSVTSPNAGNVRIVESQGAATKSNGMTTIEPRVDITAPDASAGAPLTLTFRLDGSVLKGVNPQRAIRVLRNGTGIGDCLGSTVADPNPCIAGHQRIGDDLLVTVRTSRASVWSFGFLDEAVVDRAAKQGAGRIDTAVRIAREAFSPGEVTTVVIARADTYPDALAGAPLARQLRGPLLLTTSTSLDQITREEILRLGASKIVILGGNNAVSTSVENTLRGLRGVQSVERIAGSNRFETAAKVAGRLDRFTSAYVVEGSNASAARGWPDAVSVASLAAFQGRPILLVERDVLPAATRKVLQGLASATIIGGPGAVSNNVAIAIDNVVGQVGRLAGNTRYETNYQVVLAARNAGMSVSSIWIATGSNFPDALAAGAAVAKEGGLLLLVDGSNFNNSPRVRELLAAYRNQIESVTITGGTGAVSPVVEAQIRQTTAT